MNTQAHATDSSSNDLSGVLRRVQKLLAIANDHRADANEAAAAASQAEKIMRKYQLEHADVIAAEMKRNASTSMVYKAVFANMKRDDPKRTPAVTNPKWAQFLAVAIARLHECEVRQGFDANKFGVQVASLRFYGYHADVEMCAFTFDYLVGCLIAAVAWRQKHVTKDRLATEGYRKGFINELTARVATMQSDKEREQQAQSSSRALVVSKQQAIAEAFGDFGYKAAKRSVIKDYHAYTAGINDARKVDVNRRGLEGGAGSSAGLLK